jgi:hypothetical protein
MRNELRCRWLHWVDKPLKDGGRITFELVSDRSLLTVLSRTQIDILYHALVVAGYF